MRPNALLLFIQERTVIYLLRLLAYRKGHF